MANTYTLRRDSFFAVHSLRPTFAHQHRIDGDKANTLSLEFVADLFTLVEYKQIAVKMCDM